MWCRRVARSSLWVNGLEPAFGIHSTAVNTQDAQEDIAENNAGPRRIVREALLIWIGSLCLSAVFGLLGMVWPFMADNLLAFVAATFLYLPAWILWRQRIDLAEYGLRFAPAGRGVLLFFVVTVLVMPPFYLAHHYWQQLAFARSPDFHRTRLVRFDRDLDGRPELTAGTRALHVWHEGDRLLVYWPGDGVIDVTITLETTEPDDDPVVALRGLSQSEDGRLLARGAGQGARVGHKGKLSFSRSGQGGFSFGARGLESFRVETSAEQVRIGRYAIATDPPLEQHRSPWWWLVMLTSQLILVALPEEWFYRGYLQQRFDNAFGTPWRILGANLGWGWLLASVCFALGHLVLDARPERLAVFFPSLLFGYMKARTGSVFAPTLFHALSNVWIQGLGYVYLFT